MATIIYNDRINTYNRLKVLDSKLDHRPSVSAVKEMAELRIRNLLCFNELKSLNNTGKFLYQHPLIQCLSERMELEKLFRTDPEEFLHRYKSASTSLRRYEGYVKNKRQGHEIEDRSHLQYYRNLIQNFRDIITNSNEGNRGI
jgi:hypothetical protein